MHHLQKLKSGSYDSQVDVVQLQLLQAGLDRIWDVIDVVHDLGSDEELLPVNAALLDGNTKLGLGLVDCQLVSMSRPN